MLDVVKSCGVVGSKTETDRVPVRDNTRTMSLPLHSAFAMPVPTTLDSVRILPIAADRLPSRGRNVHKEVFFTPKIKSSRVERVSHKECAALSSRRNVHRIVTQWDPLNDRPLTVKRKLAKYELGVRMRYHQDTSVPRKVAFYFVDFDGPWGVPCAYHRRLYHGEQKKTI